MSRAPSNTSKKEKGNSFETVLRVGEEHAAPEEKCLLKTIPIHLQRPKEGCEFSDAVQIGGAAGGGEGGAKATGSAGTFLLKYWLPILLIAVFSTATVAGVVTLVWYQQSIAHPVAFAPTTNRA